MLITMYIKPLSVIIESYSIIHHSFAGDLQLQMSAPLVEYAIYLIIIIIIMVIFKCYFSGELIALSY